eukprot:CFRG5126T1
MVSAVFGTTKLSNPAFCLVCGTILPLPGAVDDVECLCCDAKYKASDVVTKENIQRTRDTSFAAAAARRGNASNVGKKEKSATIKEECPECGHDEMAFHTMQLRSADEGQTCFMTCVKCGYNYSVNS